MILFFVKYTFIQIHKKNLTKKNINENDWVLFEVFKY